MGNEGAANGMDCDLCVVHIEDEYTQFVDIWPVRLSALLEEAWSENRDGDVDAEISPIAMNGSGENFENCEFRSISSAAAENAKAHYLLVGDVSLPKGIAKLFGTRMLFVIDVLRHDSESHLVTAVESIESVMKEGAEIDQVVLFTACQGETLTDLVRRFPGLEVISKSDSRPLELRMSKLIEESLTDA